MKDKKTIITMRPILIDLAAACLLTGLSESTIQSLLRNNDFPKARKGSERRALFLTREIDEWAESRPLADFLPPPKTDEGGRNGKPKTKHGF